MPWQPLPGKKGSDYHLIRGPRGQVYAVYRVKLQGGRYINVTWKIDQKDYKAFGIDPDKVNRVSMKRIKQLNVFGDAGEIVRRGSRGEHPFQTYLNHLEELYGNVSWIRNEGMVSTYLMAWAEGWSAGELQQALTQTQWYRNRTDYQRSWELSKSKAQREKEIVSWTTRVTDALGDLYGPSITLQEAGITQKEINEWARRIASGRLGNPSDGFEIWFARQQKRAQKVEGSAAWIDRQQELEEQRGFMNRPEDVFAQIREEAFAWLGPQGVPDQGTLMDWARDLVSEKRSDGDWQKFLRNQAKNLYPWLGPEEKWQDRASSYRSLAEEQLGSPIDWDDPLLGNLGAKDDSGHFTGTALAFDDFKKKIRSTNRWWGSAMAEDEGVQLANYLNNIFRGVG